MPATVFNTHYARKFREQLVLYPAATEYAFQNLLMRQVKSHQGELHWLGALLSERLHHTVHIQHITRSLEIHTIPFANSLIRLVADMHILVSNHLLTTAAAVSYYRGLQATLDSFSELAGVYTNDITEHFTGNMTKLLEPASPQELFRDIDSSLTQELKNVIGFYLNHLHTYLHFFNVALEYEREHEEAPQFNLSVTCAQLSLVNHTKKMIGDLEHVQQLLQLWETQMTYIEEQELYN
jgi:hypothetical protein